MGWWHRLRWKPRETHHRTLYGARSRVKPQGHLQAAGTEGILNLYPGGPGQSDFGNGGRAGREQLAAWAWGRLQAGEMAEQGDTGRPGE